MHCSANYDPQENESQYLAGVIVLTSMSYADCSYIYNHDINDQIYNLAKIAYDASYGYVVCSANDLVVIKQLEEDCQYTNIPKKICPGIRPIWYAEKNDQKRISTPEDAILAGADLLILGRAIFNSNNIKEAIDKTNDEIETTLVQMGDIQCF